MSAVFRIDADAPKPSEPRENGKPTPCVGLFCFAIESSGGPQLPANDQDWMRMFEVRR